MWLSTSLRASRCLEPALKKKEEEDANWLMFCFKVLGELHPPIVRVYLGKKNICIQICPALKNVTNFWLISGDRFSTQWNIHHKALVIVCAGFKDNGFRDGLSSLLQRQECGASVHVSRCCHVLRKARSATGCIMKLLSYKNPASPIYYSSFSTDFSRPHLLNDPSLSCWDLGQRWTTSLSRLSEANMARRKGLNSLQL